MSVYKVGKGRNYERYVYDALHVMYEAGISYFTLADLASWAGLPVGIFLRRYLDFLVLEGCLSVAAPQMVAAHGARTYNLNSVAWFGVIPDA